MALELKSAPVPGAAESAAQSGVILSDPENKKEIFEFLLPASSAEYSGRFPLALRNFESYGMPVGVCDQTGNNFILNFGE